MYMDYGLTKILMHCVDPLVYEYPLLIFVLMLGKRKKVDHELYMAETVTPKQESL